jgi:hypothetical protein
MRISWAAVVADLLHNFKGPSGQESAYYNLSRCEILLSQIRNTLEVRQQIQRASQITGSSYFAFHGATLL